MTTTPPFRPFPRLYSLHDRLKRAKGPDGEPLSLLDDLVDFLDDPPRDVGNRWRAGAHLCAARGITVSHMAVWRFYRAWKSSGDANAA